MSKVATLETDEQSARKIATLADTGVCGDGVAIEFVGNGGGSWRVTLHTRAASDENEVRDLIAAAAGAAVAAALRFKPVAAKNWVKAGLAGLKPVQAGRFIVYGGHDRARVAPNRIGIEIEASVAFGTGHHGTTRGCLLALDRLGKTIRKRQAPVHRHREVQAKRASNGDGLGASAASFEVRATRRHLRMTEQWILDLGTGSGVLAIAAARSLRRHVLASDIDAEAVRVAHANARLNRVGRLVRIIRADGVDHRDITARAPFDLVFANILLDPLRRLAAPLIKLTAPGARVIVSGILTSQANAVLSAYRPLTLERVIALDGWTTLVLRRAI